MQTLIELIKSGKATIVDVRTPVEFMGGHVANSKNIPLNEIPERIDESPYFVLCLGWPQWTSGALPATKWHYLRKWWLVDGCERLLLN